MDPGVIGEGVKSEVIPMIPALRNFVVPARPGDLIAARAARFTIQSNLQPHLEEHGAIHYPKVIASIHGERVTKYAKGVLLAEERGDVHVDAGAFLIVKIVADNDALGADSLPGRGPALPDIHVMAIETARPHRVKQHHFSIGLGVQSKIFMVVIIACPIVAAELVRLDAGAQYGKVIYIKKRIHPFQVQERI